MSDHTAKEQAKKADVFINPDVSKFGMFEYRKIEKLVEIGYRETKKLLR